MSINLIHMSFGVIHIKFQWNATKLGIFSLFLLTYIQVQQVGFGMGTKSKGFWNLIDRNASRTGNIWHGDECRFFYLLVMYHLMIICYLKERKLPWSNSDSDWDHHTNLDILKLSGILSAINTRCKHKFLPVFVVKETNNIQGNFIFCLFKRLAICSYTL